MTDIIKILILIATVFSSISSHAQTLGKKLQCNSIDTLAVDTMQKEFTENKNKIFQTRISCKTDTACKSIMFTGDSINNKLNKPYNKDAFRFKYDSFREKMKEPWLNDILKNIFFR